MNRNLLCLQKACEKLCVSYKVHHSSENIFEVIINNKSYLFTNWATPINRHSIIQLNRDKDYFYTFFRDVVNMPKTRSYFNPHSDPKYDKFLEQISVAEIIADIESNFEYPIIIKKNQGSWGTNVFKITKRHKLEKALLDIYNRFSSSYDYIALAQQYLDIESEYRTIFYNGKLQFCYKKDIDNATFIGNLSPFHHEGAKAVLIKDEELLDKIQNFCSPVFKKLDIHYCGIDIVIDKQEVMWLLESNSSPGFDNIIRFGYESVVVELYQTILKDLILCN
jgi:glutathione synthase/RimK-type ligase-like ATP-grasp enzyme